MTSNSSSKSDNQPQRTSVSTVKQKLKNGGYHVLERVNIWDSEKKRNKVISTKLIGKLPPGETDIDKMIPTDKKYSNKKTSLSATKGVDTTAIKDVRRQECVVYPLDCVLFVVLMASVAGYTSNDEIAAYWQTNRSIFEQWIENFPAKDISHDTVRRLICVLGEHNSEHLISKMTSRLVGNLKQRVIAVDGQAVRAASKENGSSRYLLNLFDSDNEMCLQQILVGPKQNEITRSCKLIENINIHGAVVTCDALNTQKKFCQKILDKGADYCMAVKLNHCTIYSEISGWFTTSLGRELAISSESRDIGLGRTESREVSVLPAHICQLNKELVALWPGLSDGCFVRVRSTRVDSDGVCSDDTRYYITSLAFESHFIADHLMKIIRRHWGVENNLHWVLDVTFNQDRTQCRNADYIKGRTMLTKIAFNYMSKIQQSQEKQSGKKAISKRALTAFLSTQLR